MKLNKYSELSILLGETFNEIKMIEESGLKKVGNGKLSIVEFHLIECINRGNNGMRTMGEIADAMNVTLPTVTVAINRLEKKGFIKKERSEEDHRVIMVSLTDEGRKMDRLHSFFHEQMIFAIKNEFSDDEMEQLTKLVGRLNSFFREKTENMDNEEQ